MISKKIPLTSDEKKLIRRYLIWAYKTTKEAIDRINRKYTQLKVDHKVLSCLEDNHKRLSSNKRKKYIAKIDEFKEYIKNKEASLIGEKKDSSNNKDLNPDYWYLENRLAGIEESVCHFLGKKELKTIRILYEEEMIRRILESRNE